MIAGVCVCVCVCLSVNSPLLVFSQTIKTNQYEIIKQIQIKSIENTKVGVDGDHMRHLVVDVFYLLFLLYLAILKKSKCIVLVLLSFASLCLTHLNSILSLFLESNIISVIIIITEQWFFFLGLAMDLFPY